MNLSHYRKDISESCKIIVEVWTVQLSIIASANDILLSDSQILPF